MGFEKDFERGLRDKHLGKALRCFAYGGTTEEISRTINKGLCSALREMASSREPNSILSLTEEFAHFQYLAIAVQEGSLFVEAHIVNLYQRYALEWQTIRPHIKILPAIR